MPLRCAIVFETTPGSVGRKAAFICLRLVHRSTPGGVREVEDPLAPAVGVVPVLAALVERAPRPRDLGAVLAHAERETL